MNAAIPLEKIRWSALEFQKLGEVMLREGRFELLDGEIFEMAPIGPTHASLTNRLVAALNDSRNRGQHIVSAQNPLRLNARTELYPDIAVLKYQPNEYASELPTATDALLVLEVAHTTFANDKRYKAPLYLQAGVPLVWLVSIASKSVWIFDPIHPNGQELSSGALSLAQMPRLQISVESLFRGV